MKGLRICMLIDAWAPVYGGNTVHVLELAKRLAANHACEVDIFTRKLKDEHGKPYAKDESFMGGKIRIRRVGIPTTYSSLIGGLFYVLLAPFAVRGRYDILHAHEYPAAYPAKMVSWLRKKPLVFTVHGAALKARKENDKGLMSRIKYFMEDAALFKLKYDCEISVDSSLLGHSNVNKGIEVIPNGVDTEKFDMIDSKKTEKFRVLFVGRFHHRKGLKYLVEAARDVIKMRPDAEFHLIGSGPAFSQIKEWVDVHEISDRFVFRGEVFGEDLILEYKSADVFVLPSVYEGQPLTILEAWAARLPVIATDVGGNRDLIRDGVNGYLVEAKNPGKLSEAIIKLMENPNRISMGEAGYNLVKEHYSWDRMAEKTYAVYEKLAKKIRLN